MEAPYRIFQIPNQRAFFIPPTTPAAPGAGTNLSIKRPLHTFKWGYTKPTRSDRVLKIGQNFGQRLNGTWLFNEGAGERLRDTSGMRNTATLQNSTWDSSGKFGFTIPFDGATQYATVLNQERFSYPDTTFTVNFWMNTSVTGNAPLVSKNGVTFGWEVAISSNTIIAILKDNSGTGLSTQEYTSPKIITDGNWHMITVVFTTNTAVLNQNIMSIYVDGIFATNPVGLLGLNPYGTDTTPLRFGTDGATPTNFYTGKLDFVSIWGRGLGDGEVKQLYKEPFIGFEIPQSRKQTWEILPSAPGTGVQPIRMLMGLGI